MINSGIDWAIKALDSLDTEDALTPIERLRLSFRYKIQQWILPAVSGLMDRQVGRKQLHLISAEEIFEMGICTYSLIAKGMETIQATRMSVAINPPAARHCPQCRLHHEEEICAWAWKDFWLAVVPRVLLAADQPKPLQSLVAFLKEAKINNFWKTCKMLTLFNFEQMEVLKVEINVKDHVASSVWNFYEQGVM